MRLSKITLVFIACASFGFVWAQNGTQGGPPSAGPRNGTGTLNKGQNAGQRRQAGPGLLAMPAVQAELQLTPDQISKIKDLFPGPGSNKTSTGKELEAQIRQILNSEQFKRLTELRLQAAGPLALSRPGIAKRIGLSADQVDKIKQLAMDMRTQIQALPPKDRGKQAREIREKAKTGALALLTPEQQKAWEDMLGKPFTFGRRG